MSNQRSVNGTATVQLVEQPVLNSDWMTKLNQSGSAYITTDARIIFQFPYQVFCDNIVYFEIYLTSI